MTAPTPPPHGYAPGGVIKGTRTVEFTITPLRHEAGPHCQACGPDAQLVLVVREDDGRPAVRGPVWVVETPVGQDRAAAPSAPRTAPCRIEGVGPTPSPRPTEALTA